MKMKNRQSLIRSTAGKAIDQWWELNREEKTLQLQILSPLEREVDSRQVSFTFPEETPHVSCEKCPKVHAVAENNHYFYTESILVVLQNDNVY